MNTANHPASTAQGMDSCWRRIGVWGDLSCPELVAHVHCSNCPVFAAAGRALLERPAPEGYLRQWVPILAQPYDQRVETVAALSFRCGVALLALPAAAVVTVAEAATPRRVPRRSGKIFLGLVNIAGELQLAFSLHELFGLANAALAKAANGHPQAPRLILFRHERQTYAFAVDEAMGVSNLPVPQMRAVTAQAGPTLAACVRGEFDFLEWPLLLLEPARLAGAFDRALHS